MKEYKPIACRLHDHIEHFATLRKIVDIHYLNSEGNQSFVKSIITDWTNTGDAEYMHIKENNLRIRFDNIISIDTIDFKSFDSCQIN